MARCLVLISLVFCVALARGQQNRMVRGLVKDENGHVLAGAVVEIQDRLTLQVRSYITGADGAYHFTDLADGLTYHLRAKFSGVSSRDKVFSKFSSHKAPAYDLTIDLSR